MQEHEVRDVVQRYFDCVNNDKWDAFRELWHPQCTTTPVEGPQRHGVDEVLALVDFGCGCLDTKGVVEGAHQRAEHLGLQVFAVVKALVGIAVLL